MKKTSRIVAFVVLAVVFALCFSAVVGCEQAHTHTLKEYKGSAATCTADGVEAYWQCTDETCNKYFSDKDGTVEITAPKTIPALGHEDKNKDYKCDRCSAALCKHDKIVKVDAVAATCVSVGTEEYYKCETCGQKFKDAEGKTKLATVTEIPRTSHEFADGICTKCGGRLMEAENATILSQSDNGDEDEVVQDVDSASGGKIVGQFAVAGNTLTWVFTTDKAASEVSITMMLSNCDGGAHTLGTDIVIKVNGAEVEWQDTFLDPLEGEQWHNYRPYSTKNNIQLVAGENTIEFVGVQPVSVNTDCMIVVGLDKTATITPKHICKDVCKVCGKCTSDCTDPACAEKCDCATTHTHTMTEVPATEATCTNAGNIHYFYCTVCEKYYNDNDGNEEITESVAIPALGHDFAAGANCARCGALKVEAEDLELSGTPTFSNPSFVEEHTAEELAQNNASGTGWVGNWGNGDNMMKLRITSDKAVTGAKLRIRIAYGWGSRDNLILVYPQGGNAYTLDMSQATPCGADRYYDWSYILATGIDLVAGDNVIVIEAYEGANANFDYVVLEDVGDAKISVTHVCKSKCEVCGKCTNKDCTDTHCADKCQGHVHTHVYNNGVCECGAKQVVLEAELAQGLPQSNDGDSIFKTPDGASGGMSIGQFAVVGNTITWTVSMNKQADGLRFVMKLSSCEGADKAFGSDLIIKVNGVAVEWSDKTLLHIVGEEWHNYKPYATMSNISLKDGDKIEFVNVTGVNVNVDCLVVENVPADVEITLPHMCKDKCATCGKCTSDCTDPVCVDKCTCAKKQLKIEAEDLEITGTPTYNNDSFISKPTDPKDLTDRDASGTGWAGNWGNGDNKMHIKVTADKATTVTLRIRIAPCMNTGYGDALLVYLASNTANKYAIDASAVPGFDGSNWYNWGYIVVEGIQLAEGENEIIVEANGGKAANFDYVVLEYGGDATITVTDTTAKA